MEYGKVKDMTLGETAALGVAEGAGVAGGFIVAGIFGRQVENLVKKNITTASSMTDKLLAWTGNNVPKIAAWYVLKEYGPKGPGLMTEVVVDAKKSMMGSLVYDSMIRLANHGVNPVDVRIGGIRVLEDRSSQNRVTSIQGDLQRVVQENSYLRQNLNEALGRLANNASRPAIAAAPAPQPQYVPQQIAPIVRVTPVAQVPVQNVAPITPQDRRKEFGAMESEAEARRRRVGAMPYGAMPDYNSPQHVKEREGKYGFAGMGEKEPNIATVFGML